MTNLRLTLDDTAFEQLVQLGRSVIPTVAPRWTDHNVHDPGIMLVDLASWIADAQVYALSRLRTDERRAYARLLGIEARGPRPAAGLVWPQRDQEGNGGWPPGATLPAGTEVTSSQPGAPAFYTTDEVLLTGARLVGLQTAYAEGTTDELQTSNAQEGATFLPFGPAPIKGDRFLLRMSGELAPGTAPALVALGVEMAPRDEAVPPLPAGQTPSPPRGVRPRLRLSLEDSAGARPLRVVSDTTGGLSRSGVILFRVGADTRPKGDFTIAIESATGEFLRPPRLRRVDLDVLAVEQRQQVSGPVAADVWMGTGLPDQEFSLPDPPMHPSDDDPIEVELFEGAEWRTWEQVGDLAPAGPDARVYALDLAAGSISFGNGVNGRVPEAGAAIRVKHSRTSGGAGNLPAGLQWAVGGILGVFGTNSEPTAGGAGADDLSRLRALGRHRVRENRPIVTAGDLAAAALALADLGVSRAAELAPGQGCRRVRGTRILVAVRADRPPATSPRVAETPGWLAEVRRRLAARLPLGQRLEVVGPRLVPLSVRARLTAVPNVDPKAVEAEARAELVRRLRIVTTRADEGVWPFGRDLTHVTVTGWLRRVPGVGGVAELSLFADGAEVRRLSLGATGLPDFDDREGDVVAERAPIGGRR